MATDKKETLGKLKTATSIGQSVLIDTKGFLDSAGKHTGGLPSLDASNGNPIDFLMDITVTILGSEKLERHVNKLFANLFNPAKMLPTGQNFENTFKDGLLSVLKVRDNGKRLPDDFLASGYTVPVKLIDMFDLYKSDPNHQLGKILFGQSTADFNFAFYTQVLQATGASPVIVPALPTMSFAYTPNNNFVQVKGETVPAETTVNAYFEDLLGDARYKLIDKQKIMLDVINAIFNTISANKTKASLEIEETLKNFIDKIANQETDTVFDFDPRTVEEAVNKAKTGAYTLDLGCSKEDIVITDELLLAAIANPSFSTGLLGLMGEHSPAETGNAAVGNNLYRGIFRAILFAILKNTLFSPRIWTLVILSAIFKTGWAESPYYKLIGDIQNNPMNSIGVTKDFLTRTMQDKSKLVKMIADLVLSLIVDFLLELVIKEIVKLVAPVQLAKCKESAENYKDFMKSLTPLRL